MTGRRQVRRSAEYAWLLTTPMAVLALICLAVFWILEPQWYDSWAGGLALFAAATAAHFAVLNVVIRRQNIMVTVAEIPLVLGLFFLPAVPIILAMTAAAVVTHLRNRVGTTKLLFNVAKVAAATSLALLVVRALPEIHGAGPGTWAILFTAALTYALMSHLAVSGVITLLQGRHAGQEAFQAGLPAVGTGIINIVVGLVFLVALAATPWAAVLLGVLTLAMVLIFRSYAGFLRQHRTLADVYELTLAVR